jgi:hypothetical protein
MIDFDSLRSKAILVGLFCSLAVACSSTAPAPAVERPGSGGSKASGGSPGSATGGSSGSATGGATATGGSVSTNGGAGGSIDNTGGSVATDGPDVVIDTAPEAIPEEVLPPPDAPGCTNPCNTARKRCSNDVVQECAMVNGCPVWRDAVACAAPQICAQTTNSASCACPVSCTAGRKRCSNGMLEECGMTDGCPAWKNPTACASPMTCMMTNTNASCGCPQGPCQAGDRRCAGGGLQTCAAAGAGTCPNWQAAVACSTNKECTDPAGAPADCRCKAVCTLGQKKCDGTQLAECVNVDGCPAWKNTACPAGGTCTMGNNTASCGCPADSCKVGDKICKGIGIVQECKATGTGGCGVYEDTLCNNGRQCAAGPDVGGKKTASCSCPSGSCGQGDQRCEQNGIHQTCRVTGSTCGVWENAPCAAGQSCTKNTMGNAAACTCPAGACKIGEKKCTNNHMTLTTCVDAGGGCGKFEDTACGANKVCDHVAGVATCIASCPTPAACRIGETKCDGEKLVKCIDVNGCPAFGQNTCAADQKCQNKPNTIPAAQVCCPKTCPEPNECGPGTNPTTIKKCVADANGCIVPALVACLNNGVCSKPSGGTAACR